VLAAFKPPLREVKGKKEKKKEPKPCQQNSLAGSIKTETVFVL